MPIDLFFKIVEQISPVQAVKKQFLTGYRLPNSGSMSFVPSTSEVKLEKTTSVIINEDQ